MSVRHRLALTPALAFALAYGSDAALADPGDEFWDDRFHERGANDGVEALHEFDGKLYAGGFFTGMGAVLASRAAEWDGSVWRNMGEGFNNDVLAFADYNGDLYAAGGFTMSGSTPVNGVARWTNDAWEPLTSELTGLVGASDLNVFDGKLIVAGFIDSPTVPGYHIAAYDGVGWSGVGDGLSDSGAVYEIEVYDGDLYAVGELEDLGHVARLTGTTWVNVGGGVLGEEGNWFDAGIESATVFDGKLVVAGFFLEAGSTAADGIAAWDGASWSTFPGSSFDNVVLEVGTWNGELYATPNDGPCKKWNGSAWLSFGGNSIFAYGSVGADFVVGGQFAAVNGVTANRISRFDGSTWHAMSDGEGANLAVKTFHEWNGGVIAGGTFSQAGDATSRYIARWNGLNWESFGDGGFLPVFGGEVGALETFEGDLIVGGNFLNTASGVAAQRVARFDGATWSGMGAGSPNAHVTGFEVLDSELYANGSWGGGSSTVGRWNGADFDPLSTGAPGGLNCLGSYDGDLVVGGGFTSIGGVTVTGIARWDGTTWQSLGATSILGSVYDLEQVGTDLYVAASFSEAGGGPGNRVARWDGTTWHALGDGLNNRAFGITEYNGDIYVTGEFSMAGGNPASYVARWDGAAWHALGSGLDDEGWDVHAQGGHVWVGGDFGFAGDHPADHVSRWNNDIVSTPESTPVLDVGAVRPNPFAASITIAYDLERAGAVWFSVYDVAGRRIARLSRPHQPAGSHAFAWDGRDVRGRRVAPGTYFIHLRAGGRTITRKAVLVP